MLHGAILCQNLALLEYDGAAYGQVEEHTFVGKPPARTVDNLLHFLFCKAAPKEAAKRFATCWPILDRLGSKDFRLAAFKWSEELKRSGDFGSVDLPIRKSFFEEGTGERFEAILSWLSSLALSSRLMHDFKDKPLGDYQLLTKTGEVSLIREGIEAQRHQMSLEQAVFAENAAMLEQLLAEFEAVPPDATEMETEARLEYEMELAEMRQFCGHLKTIPHPDISSLLAEIRRPVGGSGDLSQAMQRNLAWARSLLAQEQHDYTEELSGHLAALQEELDRAKKLCLDLSLELKHERAQINARVSSESPFPSPSAKNADVASLQWSRLLDPGILPKAKEPREPLSIPFQGMPLQHESGSAV